MNRTFVFLIVLLILWILLGTFLIRNNCCGSSDGLTDNQVSTVPLSQNVTNDIEPFLISDANFSISNPKNFGFLKSSFDIINSSDLKNVISQTVDHLNNNSELQLLIKGFYDQDEINNTILGNLGLARANAIKRLLLQSGAKGNQIDINAEIALADFFKFDTLLVGSEFSFRAIPESNDRLNAISDSLETNPIILYFQAGSNQLALNSNQRRKFTDLINYVDNVSDALVSVIGHSGNTSQRSANMSLSEERAEFVKNYHMQNGGIPGDRINTTGFGPDRPVASNDSQEGSSLNRSVVVALN